MDGYILQVDFVSGRRLLLDMNPFLGKIRFRSLADPQVWNSAVTNGIFVRFGNVELSHDELLSMADKSGSAIYMSFLRDGKMHVAVRTGRGFFELGKNQADLKELRQKFLDELRWFNDIIDTLRVEDNLYKKEINV